MSSLKSYAVPLLLGLLFSTVAPPSFALESYLQEIEIRSLRAGAAPRFLGGQVLLTYQSDRSENRPRLVGARFAHEDYRVFHTYSRNENGVFLLLLNVAPEVGELRYRICVDGVWMNDPKNPGTSTDPFGTVFSVFSLQGRPVPLLRSPEIEPDGSVSFAFRSEPGRRVYLIGDFNKWDPFWDRMTEERPGLYRISLRLNPGRYYYRFSVDGSRLLDPLNLDSARDREGNSVSVVEVPAQPAANLSLYQSTPR